MQKEEGKAVRCRNVGGQGRGKRRKKDRIRKSDVGKRGGRAKGTNIVILSAPLPPACRNWGVWRQKVVEKSRKGR